MKRKLLLFGLMFGLCGILRAEGVDVRLTQSEGDVRVKVAAFEKPIQVVNEILFLEPGDTITTGKNSRAELLFEGSSLLELGENTTVVIGEPSTDESDVYLFEGELDAECDSISRPGGLFRIKTPTAMVGIRGTEFSLSAKKGGTDLAVFSGKVEIDQFIDDNKLSDKPVEVGEGFQTRVFYRTPPERPFAIQKDMLKRQIRLTQLKRRLAAFRKNYKKLTPSERARKRNQLIKKMLKKRR